MNHQITKSPNHQITKSPNHQITKSPNHQITKSLLVFLIFVHLPNFSYLQSACCTQPPEYNYYVDAGGVGVSMESQQIPANASNISIFVTNGFLFNNTPIDFDNVTFVFSNSGYLELFFNSDFNGCCFRGQDNNFWQGILLSGTFSSTQNSTFVNCCFENAENAIIQSNWYDLGLRVNSSDFLNCINGILVRSNEYRQCVIYNSNFSITNPNYIRTQGSIAISTERSAVSLFNVDISGYATGIRANIFSDVRVLSSSILGCFSGLSVKFLSSAFLKVSEINGVGSTSLGVSSIDSYINANDNTIVNCNTGISISSEYGFDAQNAFNIWDNQIGTETNPFGQIGISIYNFNSIVRGFSRIHYNNIGFNTPNSNGFAAINVVNPNPMNSIEIFENQIRGRNHGILLSGVHSAYLAFNTINSNPTGNSVYGNWSGIRLEDSKNSLIFGNDIASTTNFHGINTILGTENYFCCNYTNCIVGTRFDGLSSATLKGTNFTSATNNSGLELSEFAIIGKQEFNNNAWISTAGNGAKCLNLVDYKRSEFKVQESTSPLHPVNINISDWFVVQENGYDVCPEFGFDVCGINWTPNKAKLFKSLDSFVVFNDFEGDYGVYQADQQRLSLFEFYFLDSSVYLNNNFFLDYIHENENSDYFKVAQFKNRLSSLFKDGENWNNYQQELVDYYSILDSLTELWVNDPDSVDVIFNNDIIDTLSEMISIIEVERDDFIEYKNYELEGLLESISSLEFEHEWADSIKAYYELHLTVLLRDSLYLTNPEVNRLTTIAQLCPMVFGEVVYQASTFLKLFNIIVVPDNANCSYNPPLRKACRSLGETISGEKAIYLAEQDGNIIEVFNISGSLIYKGVAKLDQILRLKQSCNCLLFIREYANEAPKAVFKF